MEGTKIKTEPIDNYVKNNIKQEPSETFVQICDRNVQTKLSHIKEEHEDTNSYPEENQLQDIYIKEESNAFDYEDLKLNYEILNNIKYENREDLSNDLEETKDFEIYVKKEATEVSNDSKVSCEILNEIKTEEIWHNFELHSEKISQNNITSLTFEENIFIKEEDTEGNNNAKRLHKSEKKLQNKSNYDKPKKSNKQKIRCVENKIESDVKIIYQCNFCDKSFDIKQKLTRHQFLHTGKSYECAICNKKVVSKYNLQKHIKTHSENRTFGCQVCHKKFKTKANLNDHNKVHYKTKTDCEICQKNDNIKDHEFVHLNIKKYKCTICPKIFIRKNNLTQHLKTHSQERNFKCMFCNKKFIHKSHCTEHEKIHADKRDFECDICFKKFVRKRHLVSHKKIHSR